MEIVMTYPDRVDKGVAKKVVQIFRNGRSRAVRIPKEFEFAADSVIMRRQPDGSLILMTATTAGLVDYLETAEPWTGGDFLSDDDDLLPPDEVLLP
jgi:antitoxin VapB